MRSEPHIYTEFVEGVFADADHLQLVPFGEPREAHRALFPMPLLVVLHLPRRLTSIAALPSLFTRVRRRRRLRPTLPPGPERIRWAFYGEEEGVDQRWDGYHRHQTQYEFQGR